MCDVLVVQVREAQLSQYNYILVVGEEEKRENTVNVRTRDNIVHGMHKVDDLLQVCHAVGVVVVGDRARLFVSSGDDNVVHGMH